MVRFLRTFLLFLCCSSVAAAAPTARSGAVNPQGWDKTPSVAVSWIQEGFSGTNLGPAVVQINTAADGSLSGTWEDRHTIAGPLADGSNGVLQLPVADIEGRHLVRVVVAGAAGSPLILGELRLDRSPPRATGITITPGDTSSGVAFTLDDNGMAGIDQAAAAAVEYLVDGMWTPAAIQPSPGPGTKLAVVTTDALAEGAYPLRVVARDAIGNTGPRDLGTIHVDRTAPVITQARVTRFPTATDFTADVSYAAADVVPGSGLDPATPARAIDAASGAVVGTADNLPGTQTLSVRFAGPGTHTLLIEVTDRGGRIGRSQPLPIAVPAAQTPLADTSPSQLPPGRVDPIELRNAGRAPTQGARWAYVAARRLHAQRGIDLTANLATTRTAAEWTTLLGTPAAAELDGYTSFAGIVALAPAPTRHLDALNRRRLCTRACPRPSRADVDRMTSALAVLLHETLHASGAGAEADYRDSASGRAFEEAFTEAATVDLLPAFVRSLKVPVTLRRDLLAGARRYRPHYPEQLGWANGLSARATNAPASSAQARAWRITVADTWGADRWTLLAAATGQSEDALRTGAPSLGDRLLR
jgi:hypothetical protein